MYSGRNYRDSLVNKEIIVSCSQEPHDFSHVRFSKEWIHSRRDRELMRLRFIEGLSYEEVAEAIKLSVTQTKTIAYKSVETLRMHCLASF